MATAAIFGINSNLDTGGIIDNLVALQRSPIDIVEAKRSLEDAKLLSFQDLKGRLQTFKSIITTLNSEAKFLSTQGNYSSNNAAALYFHSSESKLVNNMIENNNDDASLNPRQIYIVDSAPQLYLNSIIMTEETNMRGIYVYTLDNDDNYDSLAKAAYLDNSDYRKQRFGIERVELIKR